MKTLFILRHAKAEPGDESMDDFARPLSERGIQNAEALGAALAQEAPPGAILCSSSVRTSQTYDHLASTWLTLPEARYDEELYLASAGEILAILQAQTAALEHVMLIGHNPGLHQLVLMLSKPEKTDALHDVRIKFPTCAFAHIRCDIDHWENLAPACGSLQRYITRTDIV